MKRPAIALLLAIFVAVGCDDESASTEDGTNGGAGSGGAPGSLGGSAGETSMGRPSDEQFRLLFRDDFETLDLTRWQLMTHSWSTNLALFSADTVEVKDGFLTTRLLTAPEGTVDDTGTTKPFLGAEVRSVQTIEAGRVRARIRFAKGSAVVSSLVTIYTPWPADDWNELDLELLGKNPEEVQSNVMTYTGPPVTPPVSTSVSPTQDPSLHELGFDASSDFHDYEMEWSPAGVYFSIDGAVVRESSNRIELLTRPQNVLLTIWASSSEAWAGAVDETTPNAAAVYDFVEVYEYVP